MNVLFIFTIYDYKNPQKTIENRQNIPFGISYISSLLKSHGHITDVLIIGKTIKKKKIEKTINTFKPNLICFTAVYKEYVFIQRIAQIIKSIDSSIFLLIGGSHASLNPETVIKGPFDALCVGEGEFPTLELVEKLKRGETATKIKNLWFKKINFVEKNPCRKFLQDLDILPFPDREMWEKCVNNKDSRHVIILGRGCPFQCTYCCNHALKKVAPGAYVRNRSVGNILEELKDLSNKFPNLKEVYFEIETITANQEFAQKLCSKLEEFNNNLDIPLDFGVNLRIISKKNYTPLFKALRRANFRFINIGIESGSKRIRENVLKRFYSNKDIINVVKLAKSFGIKLGFLNMIGFPGETPNDFKKTIEINRMCLPNWMFLSVFSPYPSTDLYKLCIEKNYFEKKRNLFKNSRIERRFTVLNLKTFPPKKILKELEWFYYNVYKGYKPLSFILQQVFYYKLHNYPVLVFIYDMISLIPFFMRIKESIGKILNYFIKKKQ